MPNALITGCSSGFGLLAAVEFARAGFRTYATLRDLARRAPLDDAARHGGVNLEVLQLDVLDPASIARARELIDLPGGLDVLVNNAGFSMSGFAWDLTLEEYREQMDTNFFGAVATVQAFLPGMLARRRGRVINVSSIAGRFGVPGLTAYAASKWALEGYTESLRHELEPFGLYASLVEPGAFPTEIGRNGRESRAYRDPASPYRDAVTAIDHARRKRLDRSSKDPRDVAHAILEAATARVPKLRYPVGGDASGGFALRALAPWSLWRTAIAHATGLDAIPRSRGR